MIIESHERNVVTTGIDDGKSKWLKTEGRNDEVDILANAESVLTYEDEARTRFAVVDQGMKEDVRRGCMVQHVGPDSRKMAWNTNVAITPTRIIDDDVDAIETEIFIGVVGIPGQGLLSDEDVRISQARLMKNRRGCDEEFLRDLAGGNVVAFNNE